MARESAHKPALLEAAAALREVHRALVQAVRAGYEREVGPAWTRDRAEIMELLQREVRLQQVVKLVGPDALPDSQRFIIEVCTLFKNAFLQQSAFDDIDRYSTAQKQMKMLSLILTYWRRGAEAIRKGVTLVRLKRLKILSEVIKMKFNLANDDLGGFDRLAARLERSLGQLESIYDEEH
jgi:V/A-type H+-transporting ATPase subunit A